MSEISKVYNQNHDCLGSSQSEYSERLKKFSEAIKEEYRDYLGRYVHDFSRDFGDQIERLAIKSTAERFFQTSDITFVAIDGSCFKHISSGFISMYGGAYGAKGMVSLSGREGKVRYEKWELSKDVSMVAFVPIPPDCTESAIGDFGDSELENPPVLNDSEIGEISFLHTKLMQLAEIYLAWSMANATSVDYPRLIMVDNSISSILANSSFSPDSVRLGSGDFQGESLTPLDMHIALAHPLNRELGVPSTKKFQPHHRVIAEAHWAGVRTIRASECRGVPKEQFDSGCRFLERINGGTFIPSDHEFTFAVDPRKSWQKSLGIFAYICTRMFRDKNPEGLQYSLRDDPRIKLFLVPRDFTFLIGVGVRSLIEACWQKSILLTGIVKDSNSRFFYRNFMGADLVQGGRNPSRHLRVPLADRNIIEIIPNIDTGLSAPWGTIDFDSAFMTLHPEFCEERKGWVIKGFENSRLGETTRPERLFLRSLAQFLISPDRNIASHALFIDRLAYPGWDDFDSEQAEVRTDFFGPIRPLRYSDGRTPPRLQKLNMYLLSILVKNHFPQALGYPDPLHQADWGALSMERRVRGLLTSSEWAFRARPLSRTFREIRDSGR